ncbi:MAG: hypothetical protein AAF614_05150 [Chloroflexota bacterium]
MNRLPLRFISIAISSLFIFILFNSVIQATAPEPVAYLPIVKKPPQWANGCGDGHVDRILDNFDDGRETAVFTPHHTIPNPQIFIVPNGCRGKGFAIEYDVTNITPPNAPNAGQSWVVIQRPMSTPDLTPYTHLRLALRGDTLDSHQAVEVKLKDGNGQLAAISLKSLADLPVWRPIYIDFRELSDYATLDLSNITHFEIGIVRCDENCEVPDVPSPTTPPNNHQGVLWLDELAIVDLKPGAPNRLNQTTFEHVTPNRDVQEDAAKALYQAIVTDGPGTGLVPAWFPEANANFNSYVQAEALLVFIYEYERTLNPAYRNAANALAETLMSLQVEEGKPHAGAWFSAYWREGDTLRPPNRPDNSQQCDGTETAIPHIDGCMWVGNVGWVLIALGKLQDSGIYPYPEALQTSIALGTDWIEQKQIGRETKYPNLISRGMEGNISAYFGLLAAGGDLAKISQLGDGIFVAGWDEVQQRMKPGVDSYATSIDTSGSWGAIFLRTLGKEAEALSSQGYAATVMRTTSFDGTVLGYGDIAGPYTVTVEFGAQAAAAGILDASFVMKHLRPLQLPDDLHMGAFPGATDHWYGGQLEPWSTTMSGVSPTAWVYFAENGDPLLDILARTGK